MGRSAEAKAGFILAGFLVVEGAWVLLNLLHNPEHFLSYLGFAPGQLGAYPGWLLAALTTAVYVLWSTRLPSVRANLVRPSWLKLLALPMALAAGILEEAVFRRALMDHLQGQGWGVVLQVAASALAFGLAHGIWGVFARSWRAVLGPTVVTGVLGLLLALVYLASGRSVAACVAAHFLIDAFIEPGIALAATRGEFAQLRMRRGRA